MGGGALHGFLLWTVAVLVSVGPPSHTRTMAGSVTVAAPSWASVPAASVTDLMWLAYGSWSASRAPRVGGMATAAAWVGDLRAAPVSGRTERPVSRVLAEAECLAAQLVVDAAACRFAYFALNYRPDHLTEAQAALHLVLSKNVEDGLAVAALAHCERRTDPADNTAAQRLFELASRYSGDIDLAFHACIVKMQMGDHAGASVFCEVLQKSSEASPQVKASTDALRLLADGAPLGKIVGQLRTSATENDEINRALLAFAAPELAEPVTLPESTSAQLPLAARVEAFVIKNLTEGMSDEQILAALAGSLSQSEIASFDPLIFRLTAEHPDVPASTRSRLRDLTDSIVHLRSST